MSRVSLRTNTPLPMNRLLRLLPAMLLLACTNSPQKPAETAENWIPLFNGKDLSGWDIKIRRHALNDNYLNTFRVEEGVLKVSYDEYEDFGETFGHIFYNQPFSHYRLRVEYRFVGDQCPGGPGWATRNNGLMLHSQSAASMAINQDFPISIEVQLLGGNGTDERPTANLCTPGTHVFMNDSLFTPHCVNSSSKTYHGDQWVQIEIQVYGDSLFRHIVEGDTVLEYTRPQVGGGVANDYDPAIKVDGTPLTSGYIALQGESHPTEFRKIELLKLDF